jgi:hypothetical protein
MSCRRLSKSSERRFDERNYDPGTEVGYAVERDITSAATMAIEHFGYLVSEYGF